MIVLHLFMNKTKLGTAMRASSMDSMAAESCGINVSLTTGITWGVSAMLAAMAGILICCCSCASSRQACSTNALFRTSDAGRRKS